MNRFSSLLLLPLWVLRRLAVLDRHFGVSRASGCRALEKGFGGWGGGLAVAMLLVAFAGSASGAGVDGRQAAKAARSWLVRTGNPMECGLEDGEVASVETRTGEELYA